MAKIGEKEKQFLADNAFVGVVTDLRMDGSPHSTVVWVDVEGDKVAFNTARGRVKPRNLEHDPRVSLLVLDPSNVYKWVSVSGSAEVTEEGADEQIDMLAKKYLGEDKYPWRNPEETRLKVLIEPERVYSYGLDS